MDIKKIKVLHARLKGIRDITSDARMVPRQAWVDYNNVVDEINVLVDEDFSSFKVPHIEISSSGRCLSELINVSLFQLLSYLESMYNLTEEIVEIGSIYNSIQDGELKNRCSDILTASGNFDRVINQATLVLEDRIRKKGNLGRQDIGVGLVNKALNADLSRTILKISDDQDEHEGICHICRGMMMSFRNPTHHYITHNYSREDALKVCAFVDNLLMIIDRAEKIR